MLDLIGESDRHLRQVESLFPEVHFVARGDEVVLKGSEDDVEKARTVLDELLILVQEGHPLDEGRVIEVVKMVRDEVPSPSGVLSDGIPVGRGRMIRPKTHGQQKYIEAIRENTLTFGIGPAGTGKTYLAMAAAVDSLINGVVRRIVLTRPAVEAGERLGFLPGDVSAKVDPYLRPLYDALWDMLGPEETASLIKQGTIEIAPLAYMRGRTLNDACVILDEAQNTTPEQMKMFLTRLGFNSKMIITGDVSQTDLPTGRHSGLHIVRSILTGIPGVSFIELGARDVVRHRIVASIVEAYERFETEER
ncbi:MAG: PhoH family protein [Acidobacteria bacterium]|nr:PhoH family protein [Acidobacteriota bacterium]TDI54760.1 MAG: PhoH family protein [Acidobacteriota bacterium]